MRTTAPIHRPSVVCFLSTNDFITTGDRPLSSATTTPARDSIHTWKKETYIPTDLSSGTTYYIGAIVDPYNIVGEIDETNNATYIAVEIK